MARNMLPLLLAFALVATASACASPPSPAATPTTAVAVAETQTPVPTATGEPTLAPTGTATASVTVTASATFTPTASATAVGGTPNVAAKPTNEPSATAASTPRPTASPTVPPTAVPATATRAPVAKRATLGYYVPYDSSSWQSLVAQADLLDYVALQVATLDYCGNVSARDDRTLLAFARSRGLPVLASVFTSAEPLNHSILTAGGVADNAVRSLVNYVVDAGYDGLDVDFEAVPATDRPALTAFVTRLAAALRAQGKLVTMAVPAKSRDVTTGWAGAYDYAALAPSLDLVVLMSYSYTTASSSPGSTAPYDWVSQVTAYAASQIPPDKILMGVAFFGYDWNTTSGGRARALRYPQAAAVASAYGASIGFDAKSRSATFTYTARPGDAVPGQESLPALSHDMVDRRPGPCPLGPGPGPTAVPRTPTPIPTPSAVQSHVVWLENAASLAARLEIVDRLGVRGVAAWRLGQEDPTVWSTIGQWKR
ncbi:MAG: glycosyl hydrolase family 18 protein [Chloroflexota bacterium]